MLGCNELGTARTANTTRANTVLDRAFNLLRDLTDPKGTRVGSKALTGLGTTPFAP